MTTGLFWDFYHGETEAGEMPEEKRQGAASATPRRPRPAKT